MKSSKTCYDANAAVLLTFFFAMHLVSLVSATIVYTEARFCLENEFENGTAFNKEHARCSNSAYSRCTSRSSYIYYFEECYSVVNGSEVVHVDNNNGNRLSTDFGSFMVSGNLSAFVESGAPRYYLVIYFADSNCTHGALNSTTGLADGVVATLPPYAMLKGECSSNVDEWYFYYRPEKAIAYANISGIYLPDDTGPSYDPYPYDTNDTNDSGIEVWLICGGILIVLGAAVVAAAIFVQWRKKNEKKENYVTLN